jgi:general secretion pathway protein K
MTLARQPARYSGCRRGADGFIVVAVLWILGAFAALIAIFAVYVANTAVGLDVNDDRLQSEASMSAALELTAYQLTGKDPQSRPTRGFFTFSIGRSTVIAEFRSEAARIDLNAAPKELLAGLFGSLGATPEDAAYYAARIVGWRTKAQPEGQNEEAALYRAAGKSYGPRQAPFASVGELWLVLGLPPALVERALPLVTVFSGRGEINVLDAQAEVLAALPGMTPERLYAVLAQQGIGKANEQIVLGLLGPAAGSATTEGSKAMRVTARILFDNGRQVGAEAVILVVDEGEEPFRVLSWRDDFDGAS